MDATTTISGAYETTAGHATLDITFVASGHPDTVPAIADKVIQDLRNSLHRHGVTHVRVAQAAGRDETIEAFQQALKQPA